MYALAVLVGCVWSLGFSHSMWQSDTEERRAPIQVLQLESQRSSTVYRSKVLVEVSGTQANFARI